MKPADYLSYYATRFDTVEIDSTFYRTPTPTMVNGWANESPDGFLIAAKMPRTITHEKCLVECDREFGQFIDAMDLLNRGKRLGPLLFQFAYFNKDAFKSQADFLAALTPFRRKLPKGYQFAIEIRNKNWLDERFAEILRERNVALGFRINFGCRCDHATVHFHTTRRKSDCWYALFIASERRFTRCYSTH